MILVKRPQNDVSVGIYLFMRLANENKTSPLNRHYERSTTPQKTKTTAISVATYRNLTRYIKSIGIYLMKQKHKRTARP